MSWLIVAKMPLLISSRMTSAGFTARSSASSLTVIVAGRSMAPRSRGSATWTGARLPPSLRGGLRGPRLPRVPLLLLATLSSFGRRRQCCCVSRHGRTQVGRHGRLQRPSQRAALQRGGPAGLVPAEVGAPAVQPASFVDLQFAVRRPHDPDQVPLVPGRPTGDTGPGGSPASAGRRGGYDSPLESPSADAGSASALAFLVRAFFAGAAAAATASGASSGVDAAAPAGAA